MGRGLAHAYKLSAILSGKCICNVVMFLCFVALVFMYCCTKFAFIVMVKNCCAVGCNNTYRKGSGIHFYRFPRDPERKAKWISAVRRAENWTPTEYSWLCSEHFISGKKSNNPLAPNYIPTIFKHVSSPEKRRLDASFSTFERRQAMKRKRTEQSEETEETRVEITEETLEEMPVDRREVQVRTHYEQVIRFKEQWKLEERVKDLEKKCEDIMRQTQIYDVK